MATLTVWKFDTPGGAEEAEKTLVRLAKQELITVQDAAMVSWPEGRKSPKTKEATNLAGAGALGGAFWGLLFGLLFFVPLFGMAVGAAMGAITGAMTDVGIDDDFIAAVRDQVQPGTSALFVMTSDAVVDKVREEFGALNPQLIHSNLTQEQEDKLREVFAEG